MGNRNNRTNRHDWGREVQLRLLAEQFINLAELRACLEDRDGARDACDRAASLLDSATDGLAGVVPPTGPNWDSDEWIGTDGDGPGLHLS